MRLIFKIIIKMDSANISIMSTSLINKTLNFFNFIEGDIVYFLKNVYCTSKCYLTF